MDQSVRKTTDLAQEPTPGICPLVGGIYDCFRNFYECIVILVIFSSSFISWVLLLEFRSYFYIWFLKYFSSSFHNWAEAAEGGSGSGED